MFDPGLQRIPNEAAREILEHRQGELEAEAQHHRDLQAARAARRGTGRIHAALRRARQVISRHH